MKQPQEVYIPQGFSVYEGKIIPVEGGWFRVDKIVSVTANGAEPLIELAGEMFEDYDEAHYGSDDKDACRGKV